MQAPINIPNATVICILFDWKRYRTKKIHDYLGHESYRSNI